MKDPWNPDRAGAFLNTTAGCAATAIIHQNGLQFVSDAEFWRWMSEEVVKRPGLFDSAEAIQRFVLAKPHGSEVLIQGRGMEWDWVRDFNNDPRHVLQSASLGSMADDRAGIDAHVRRLFGSPEQIQMKTAMSDTGAAVNLEKYGPDTRVVVNERITEWRRDHPEAIQARGDVRPVETAYSDSELKGATDRRMEQARRGDATPGVTLGGAMEQIGKGALIGAVVSVGAATLLNYSRFERGEISGQEFGDLIVRDAAQGALTGGVVAAVNIPVQMAATALGVGAPVTIPVMLLVGVALSKVVNPIFGKGEYQVALNQLMLTKNLAQAHVRFAQMSIESLEMQRPFLEGMMLAAKRAAVLNSAAANSDQMLESALYKLERGR